MIHTDTQKELFTKIPEANPKPHKTQDDDDAVGAEGGCMWTQ